MEDLRLAAAKFGLEVLPESVTPFGKGLIHETWRVETPRGARLLQRLNPRVFPDLEATAGNAAAAAGRVDDALQREGDDDPRHRLTFLTGPDGNPWFGDEAGAVWRAAVLIPDSRPADAADPREVHAAARELGRFPGLVSAGSGPELRVTLPGFHDTGARFAHLVAAAESDSHDRKTGCRVELSRLAGLEFLADRVPAHNLPTRFVHNDAKLDNVLVDAVTGEALCVIDLDTVMPGPAPHDFGDLVRSAVTGRPEDEPDTGRISVSEEVFDNLARGYLEGASGWIEESERDHLFDGALVITFEQALRFLADHLAGDVYYPVDDAGHNLRRVRAQLKLLEELLKNEDILRQRILDLA